MNWWKSLKGKVKQAEPLKNHTTFRIGGPARFFIEPSDPQDLKLLLGFAKKYNLPVFIIGSGSNLLVNDKGINGVVIRLGAPYFNRLSCKGSYLNAGSGVPLGKVIFFAREHGLSGAEFLAGIPGTVGGALAMNAGTVSRKTGARSIQDLVKEVTVMDYSGNIMTLQKKDIKFGYRKSSLSKYIILGANIKLAKADRGKITQRIKEYMGYRKSSQDLSRPSAGCVFKNPAGDSAGRLIDLCGLKGKRVGCACVSLKHANFILNLGRGRAADVIKLMKFVSRKVSAKFNISLTPEIRIWQN